MWIVSVCLRGYRGSCMRENQDLIADRELKKKRFFYFFDEWDKPLPHWKFHYKLDIVIKLFNNKRECRDCPAKAKPQIMWRISLLHILWLGKFSTYFLTILNLTWKHKIMFFLVPFPNYFCLQQNFFIHSTIYKISMWVIVTYLSVLYMLNNALFATFFTSPLLLFFLIPLVLLSVFL